MLGDKGYQGTFALLVAGALGLMIFGWRHSTPELVYVLPMDTRSLTMVMMVIALMLFAAAKIPTRIKQFVRHPQLTGLIMWSLAHLLSNGDNRSIVLFGGLGLWALLEILLINRREGAWLKPEIPSWGQEIRGLAISLVILVVLVFAHPYLSGVPLI
jgi:uncharacterized membrane protein